MKNSMTCKDTKEFFDAYLDNELDTGTAIHLDAHLKHCESCQKEFQQTIHFRNSIAANIQQHPAPNDLKKKIMLSLNQSSKAETNSAIEKIFQTWSSWLMPTFSSAVLLLAFGLFWFKPATQDVYLDELVSTHVRSLQEQHLMDVVSTDKHTVKPWFAGRLDFSPAVFDFSAEGYPLIGGRLDYLNHQTVAALIYKHNKHVINVFVAPVTKDSLGEINSSKRGYSLVVWQHNRLEYSAVSDLNKDELKVLAEKMREKNPND